MSQIRNKLGPDFEKKYVFKHVNIIPNSNTIKLPMYKKKSRDYL